MAFYSYKIVRDYGFAPNPFFGFCTLACCKPHVRNKAEVGDWIFGTGAAGNGLLYHLIFLMKVTEKMTFENYWADPRFARKKPVINGSLKQIHGDNIYFKNGSNWCQMDSHHSLPDGSVNEGNLKQDLSGNYVLVSNRFIYLGDNCLRVPEKFESLCPNSKQRDYISIENTELASEFIDSLFSQFPTGVKGRPINWVEYNQLSLF